MRTNNFFFTALASFFVLASCSSKSEVTENVNLQEGVALVSGIELSESLEEGVVTISSEQELKYNVFKLSEPERIMIDVIDAQLASGLPVSIEGSGIVKSVQIQAVEDSLSQLVRVEVELNESANYLAGLEEGSLSIRVIPAAFGAPSDAEPIEVSSAESSDSEPVIDDLFSVEGDALAAIPSLDEPSLDLPEVGSEGDTMDLPALELPSIDEMAPPADTKVTEIAPLPAPVPVPLEELSEETEEKLAENEVKIEAPAPVVEPAPVPVAEMPVIEEPVADSAETKVIVEPEGEPAPQVETQDIPTTEFTEGTSLLSGIGGKVYTGKRVSLEFQDAPVQDVVRLIADVSKLNIILADDVKGNITLKLVDVPWDQALDIILTSKGLDKVQHGNILRVAPVDSLKKEREIALANDKAAKQLEPTKLKIFNINYATSAEMGDRIKALLSERGNVDTDDRTNTLIVEDIPENLSKVENLIRVLDTQTPQVRIESRIVQANDNFTRALGIQWGPALALDGASGPATGWQFPNTVNVLTTPPNAAGAFAGPTASALSEFAVDALAGGESTGGSLGFRLGSINNTFNLDLRLSYAENEQLARVVSRPSVTVLDNRTARIIQGSRIPFLSSSSEGSNVQFQEAGIEISVTPQITNDGSVILEVSTRSNEPGGESVGGNPIINIREASTNMLVKSGRTAVLGGVFKTRDTRGKGGVPGLMSIPVLGWLFKGESNSKVREEMLIFLTPYILSDARSAQMAPSSSTEADPQ